MEWVDGFIKKWSKSVKGDSLEYKHNANQELYTVLHFAVMQVGQKWLECVVYKITASKYDGKIYVREREDFDRKFTKI